MIKQRRHYARRCKAITTGFAAVALCFAATTMGADTPLNLQQGAATPRISIIIDDLGDKHAAGLRSIKLPGAVTMSFLPHTPYSKSLAISAHKHNKEVMIHLPMQSMEKHALGRGGLTMNMDRRTFDNSLHASFDAVPYAVGLNNHMGSLLTRHPGHMQWLMEALKDNGKLYFVDSRTTHLTVAQQLAEENKVPSLRRDVFLDDDPSTAAIAHEFQRLIHKARKHGTAIGIGHPYDSTLEFLESALPKLASAGIQLVPVSQLFEKPAPKTTPNQRLAEPAHSTDHLVFNQTILPEKENN